MALHEHKSTHELSSPPIAGMEERQTVEIKRSLRRLDRKDVWYWWNAILVIMLLMGAIGALSLPSILHADDPNYNVQLSIAVRGLLGLVLIFNLYTLYQQYLLKQLRKHLAGQVELATEQQVRAKTFYELAILDPLTGLYNRRFCDERLKAEIQRADRHHLPLMVVTVDLDNFKQINDSFGHAAGDTVLREFSRHLNKTIRGADFAVRLGGDEFLLVLPECPPEYVGLVMSRLTPLQVDCEGILIAVQSSRGWAQYQSDDTPDVLIERADRVLYEQKQSRRAGALQDLTPA
jgi:diguanylate cyclase (GGDEF)-like protein